MNSRVVFDHASGDFVCSECRVKIYGQPDNCPLCGADFTEHRRIVREQAKRSVFALPEGTP